MREVIFGGHHTAEDWGLILNAKSINPPTPKVVTISVDGRDGDINLSRALTGEMKFNNREASFTFLLTEGSESDREELLSTIINAIHGQELQIVEPDRPDYYLVGECNVNSITNGKGYGSFKVSANCEPYYYYAHEVNRIISLTETPTNVILSNVGRKTLTPTVVVDGEVNLTFGSSNASLASGTYKLSALLLKSGTTTVSVSGTGTITFTYREAVL